MVKPISEFRKPEIVEAALKAIGKSGLPMPSYDAIAKEADMSRQLIRHYFPDPETLMVTICDALADRYRRLLVAGILDVEASERLPKFLDFYFGLLGGKGLPKPEDDAVYDAMFSLARGSERVRSALFEQYHALQHTIANLVQASRPDLDQRACREIGFIFVSLMYGHWKMVATMGFSESHNRVTREAMDRIIASYCGRGGAKLEPAAGEDTAAGSR